MADIRNEEDRPPLEIELENVVRGFFSPELLLDYIRYFILFEQGGDGDDGIVKKIASPPAGWYGSTKLAHAWLPGDAEQVWRQSRLSQEAKIRAMATVQGAQLLEIIVDGGESAKTMNRPGMQKLLALVSSGKVQAVVVAKLDRLTRSVKDLCGVLELFEKRRVALVSVAESLDTGSAAGRLVITIMGAVSQWSARRSPNEPATPCDKSGPPVCAGNVPFGYRLAPDGRHLEPEPVEQAALWSLGELRRQGQALRDLRRRGHSLRETASALNGRGHRTRRGTEWRQKHVRRVLAIEAGQTAASA